MHSFSWNPLGLTIMLNMLSESIKEEELSEELFEEIKEMVELRGANADIADYSGNTALHYLAKINLPRICLSQLSVDIETTIIQQMELQKR